MLTLRESQAAEPRAREESFGLMDEPGRSGVAQVLAQQAAVAEIGQHALGERRLDVLLADTCALVSRVLATELVSVLELTADGRSLRNIAGVGWRPGVVGQLVIPASTGSQAGYTLATGAAVIVEDLTTERRFAVPPVLPEHGAISGISVRIGEPAKPFGTINAFTGRRGRFTRDDVRFLEAVAGILASAIARFRAEDELRHSRDELAEILASVSEGITVQSASGRLLYANDAAARLTGFATATELLAAPNDEILARFELLDDDGQPLSPSRLPGRTALATGRRDPPMVVRFLVRATGEERWSQVGASPIFAADGSVSQVVTVFRDITAQRLHERSQELIDTALDALAETLDPDEAAHRLADVCVPQLADFAEVDLFDADGGLALAAMTHVDAGLLERARRERAEHEPSLDDRGGAGSSYVRVPLLARDRPIGALTLGVEEPRRIRPSDVALAEELGRRAGGALENAQLFRNAVERRSELDAVLGAMAEAVMVFDAAGRLRLSNPAAGVLLERVPATVDGLRERLATETTGMAPTEDELSGEFQLAGSDRWLEIRTYVGAEDGDGGRRSSLIVVARDVTSNRFAQTTREAFLGVMSHELRTPITTIYGGSELLAHGLDEERRAEVIRDIRAESGRLVRLVEDLLVMTRVERGVLELADEPLLLQRLLPAVVASLAQSWPTLAVELDIAERLPAVRGDATYIEQVVRNLIINAIRYGEAINTGVVVTAEPGPGEVRVRVLDRGPGLGDADPDRLFDLFFRAPAARAVSGGAGIGLFVCRSLVDAMGGRMWASARGTGGAEFGFALLTIEAD